MALDVRQLLDDARERKSLRFVMHDQRPADFEALDARLAFRYGNVVSEHLALRSRGSQLTADGTVQTAAGRIYLRLLMDHGYGLARTARIGRSQSVLIHGDLADPVVVAEEPAGGALSAAALPPVWMVPAP